MRRWAEFILRHRWQVAVFWLVILVAGMAAAGQATSRLSTDFSLPGQPGEVAAKKIIALYGNGGETPPTLMTLTLPADQTIKGNNAGEEKANEEAIAKAFAPLAKLPVSKDQPATATHHLRLYDEANTHDTKTFRTGDDRTAYAMVFYAYPKDPTAKPLTDTMRDAVKTAAPQGAQVGATGMFELQIGDSGSGSPSILIEVLLGGVGALLVLVFVFASFLALLPLVVALVSILAAFLFLLPLTYVGHISFIVEFLIALVGLGVAIDYSLLLVTRWREERDHGRDNHDAVVVAMETAGHAVLFSGMTVAIGLIALVVLPVPFMQSMGVGGALIPLTSVMATLSLTPVILSSIGPKVDWPKIRHENMASRGWSKWAAMVVKRRWISAGLALAALGALLVVLGGVKIGQSSSDSQAKTGPAYEALQTLKKGGITTGVMTPIEVIVKADDAQAVADRLSQVKGVTNAVVANDVAVNGQNVVLVLPKDETVNGKSVDVVRDIISASKSVPGVIGLAGIGAGQIDFLKAVYGNFPLMLILLALFTYVLLVRAFRSLLLPFKAVLLNLISLGATIGMMTLFWQDGIGSDALFGISATGAITFWIPLMVFAFLFGLSMDYEVFILARIREEYDGARSTDAAVIEGIGRTGRLVTSAALILFLSFAALASGPGTDTKVMATGLGFGVLLDATIVRSLLVPSLVSLFGKWNWYLPDWVAKVLRVAPSVAHPEPSRKELAAAASPVG